MKNLFRSETAYELLSLFTQEPVQKRYLAEIAKALQKDMANTTRELEKLVKEEILVMTEENGKKYYRLNSSNPFTKELSALFKKLDDVYVQRSFQNKWLLAEDIPNMDPFFSMLWMRSFVDEFKNPSGVAYKEVVGIFKDYHLWFFFDEKDAYNVGEHIVNKMEKSPEFMEEVNKEIVKHSDKLRDFALTLPEENLKKLSNKKLWELYKKHDDIHTAYYQWGWIPVAADMFGGNLTTRGKEILKQKGVSEEKVNEYLNILTQPTAKSAIAEEQESLERIGALVQEDSKQVKIFAEIFRKFKEEDVKKYGLYTHSEEYEKLFEETVRVLESQIAPKILKKLQEHFAKYFYTKFLFTEEQGVYSFEHYLKSLVRLVNYEPNLAVKLQDESKELARNAKIRSELIKKLKLNTSEIRFFDAWGEFMVTKIYRRFAQLFALYKMVPILTEIGARFGLTLKQTKFLMYEEIRDGLLEDRVNKEMTRQRVAFSVFVTRPDSSEFITGLSAKKIAEVVQKEHIEQVSEFSGQCGCPGIAEGRVRIINEAHEMSKMHDGDILVAISTQPDLVPAMKKAAAIITDQGGVTSHAAIVAREMRTPCVIGTKIGSKLLHDGDYVKVDATKGKVLIIESAKK